MAHKPKIFALWLFTESLLTPRVEVRSRASRGCEDFKGTRAESCHLQLKPDGGLCTIKGITQMVFCLQSSGDQVWKNCRDVRVSLCLDGMRAVLEQRATCTSVCVFPSLLRVKCQALRARICVLLHDKDMQDPEQKDTMSQGL